MPPTMVPCAVIYDLTSMVLIHKMFWQLAHCLPLQRNPDLAISKITKMIHLVLVSFLWPYHQFSPTPSLDIQSYGCMLEFATSNNGLTSKCPYSTILHSCYPLIICTVHFLFEFHFNYIGAPIYGPYHIFTLCCLCPHLYFFYLLAWTP